MNELERYKKAYATLNGQVDTVVSKLKESAVMLNLENTGLRFAIDALIKALLEAEETIIAEDGE